MKSNKQQPPNSGSGRLDRVVRLLGAAVVNAKQIGELLSLEVASAMADGLGVEQARRNVFRALREKLAEAKKNISIDFEWFKTLCRIGSGALDEAFGISLSIDRPILKFPDKIANHAVEPGWLVCDYKPGVQGKGKVMRLKRVTNGTAYGLNHYHIKLVVVKTSRGIRLRTPAEQRDEHERLLLLAKRKVDSKDGTWAFYKYFRVKKAAVMVAIDATFNLSLDLPNPNEFNDTDKEQIAALMPKDYDADRYADYLP